MKHLEINQRTAKHMHTENYKTLLKEIKEDLSKCEDIPDNRLEDLRIARMLTLP